MSQLTDRLSQYRDKIQATLFPWIEEQLDPLTEKQQQLVTVLELVRINVWDVMADAIRGSPRLLAINQEAAPQEIAV